MHRFGPTSTTYEAFTLGSGSWHACADDFSHPVIEEALQGLDVETYVNNVAVFSDSYDEHIKTIAEVCCRLQDNRLTSR